MNLSEGEIQLVSVTEAIFLEFLKEAQRRVIIAKPGYSLSEVKTLLNLAEKKGLTCTVYVDPGENAIRWGFGGNDALKKINENISKLHVQTCNRIRMSVVIVDDYVLVYAPIALSWENEPESLAFPNGFIGGYQIAESFFEQINATENDLVKSDKIIPFPRANFLKKSSSKSSEEITKTVEKLDKNPPVDPSKLRKVTVYRNNYKLLKFQIKGIKIRKKSISLKPFNSLFPNLSERLKASWHIFTQEDMKQIREISIFLNEADSIVEKYTLDVGRFGLLIKTEDKSKFEQDIKEEKEEFLEALKLKPNEEPKNKESKYLIPPIKQKPPTKETEQPEKQTLGALLERSKEELKKYMRHMIKDNPGSEKGLFEKDRTLFGMYKSGKKKLDEVLPGVLNTFITHSLKFPEAEHLIEKMDITIDYYDVSNEMLYENDEFQGILNQIKNSQDASDELKIRQFSYVFEENEKVS